MFTIHDSPDSAPIEAWISRFIETPCNDLALMTGDGLRRLIEVAKAHHCEDRLRDGLKQTPIASVGPVVSDELKSHGLRTDIYPANDAYFMKPLISAMAAELGKSAPRAAAEI